jgi:hypothetical protein
MLCAQDEKEDLDDVVVALEVAEYGMSSKDFGDDI